MIVRTKFRSNRTNDLRTREGSLPDPLPPPPKLAETEDGPLLGPFFFWFQRGLVSVTALRRLPKLPKLVSKSRLSLIDRPQPSEGRFQNVV